MSAMSDLDAEIQLRTPPAGERYTGPVFEHAHVGRLDTQPSSYVALQIGADRIVERRVVDGQVIEERELSEVPDRWPATAMFGGAR